MIQNIDKNHQIQPEKYINFKFTKPGYSKLLIFDLDETLIHCYREEIAFADPNYFQPDNYVMITNPEDGENIKAEFSIRPFTKECLIEANKYFEVAVFTAGLDWYANPIIDKIDPKGDLIQHRYFQDKTITYDLMGQEVRVKDLRVF